MADSASTTTKQWQPSSSTTLLVVVLVVLNIVCVNELQLQLHSLNELEVNDFDFSFITSNLKCMVWPVLYYYYYY